MVNLGLTHVPRTVEVLGEPLTIWEWPEDVPSSEGWSEEADFLAVADRQEAFATIARLICSPFPRAKAAMCRNFDQMLALIDVVRPSAVITMNQNLFLTKTDSLAALNVFLRERPDLRFVLLTGHPWIADAAVEPIQFPDRLFVGDVPLHPARFIESLQTELQFRFPEDPRKLMPASPSAMPLEEPAFVPLSRFKECCTRRPR
jgi:hypothetical protein